MCDKHLVKINGKIAKPSRNIVVGDIIEIDTIKGTNRYRVLIIPEGNVKKNETDLYYEKCL